MAIISSEIKSQDVQADGRIYVTETHTDDKGNVMAITYLAVEGTDYEAEMAARAEEINSRPEPELINTFTAQEVTVLQDAVGLLNDKYAKLSADEKLEFNEKVPGLVDVVSTVEVIP